MRLCRSPSRMTSWYVMSHRKSKNLIRIWRNCRSWVGQNNHISAQLKTCGTCQHFLGIHYSYSHHTFLIQNFYPSFLYKLQGALIPTATQIAPSVIQKYQVISLKMLTKLLKHIYQQLCLRYQIKQDLISSFSPVQWNTFQLYIHNNITTSEKWMI